MAVEKDQAREALTQMKLKEGQRNVERRKDFKEGLEFLDEKVVPVLEEFNKSVLEDKGYITLEVVKPGQPVCPPDRLKLQAVLEWRQPNQGSFDQYKEVRAHSVAVQFSPKTRVNLPFSKKDAPALLIYGGYKGDQSVGTVLVGGRPGGGDESFQVPILNKYTKTRPASDWIPEFISVIKRVYDYEKYDAIKRVSLRFHYFPEDIQQLEQTIRAIDEESIARKRRKPWVNDRKDAAVHRKTKEEILSELKISEKSAKEKAPTPEQSRTTISNTIRDINKKVFSGRLLVQRWQEEESLHEHATGGGFNMGDWRNIQSTPISSKEHHVKAFVLRITLPNGRIIRFFMETDKRGISVDQYDREKEPRLCTYSEKLLDSCGPMERSWFSPSSVQTVKKIVFSKIVEEYVKKTLVNRV